MCWTLKTNYSSANVDIKDVSYSIAKFSAKFCYELDKTKSVASSPLSAETLLALITLGTESSAHEELVTSLGIPDDDAIRSSFSVVSSKLKNLRGVTLDVANKVYIKKGDYDLHPQLKKDAGKIFNARFEKIDFDEGSKAAHTINKWVERKTNRRIKEMLSGNSLNEDTRLVLVNALYFKGTWEKKFDPHNTNERLFHIDYENTILVPMMYKEDDFMYGESKTLGVQLLQLFYKGKKASMLIVLPRDVTGLDSVMQKLAAGYDLLAELDTMCQSEVRVTLPKFKIETEIDLTELLPKLGIKSIFDLENSGLTKVLNKNEPLVVSKAIQKACIEVNEEGAEAAAATGTVYMEMCLRSPRCFRADRPFFYVLLGRDRTLLFVGAYRAA